MRRYPRTVAALTIDELARETGLTVRNVRSHHARGLLPPPEVKGRTGYYGPEHVRRLRLIQELQQEGLKLEGIKRLLGDDGEKLLALKRAGADSETPEVITATELRERFGGNASRAPRPPRPPPPAATPPEFITATELRERFGDAPGLIKKAAKLGV